RMAIGWQQGGGGVYIRARWGAGVQTVFNNMTFINGMTGNFFADEDFLVGITNLPPENLTFTSAVIRAQLEAEDAIFDVQAYWGPTDGGTNAAAWSNATFIGSFSNLMSTNLSLAITGLTAATDYFYTFRMSNCAEVTYGSPSMAFSTIQPPVVDNTGAILGGSGAASLYGELLTGGVADVTVYWGLSDGGSTSSAWDSATGLGSVLQGPFSLPLSNLLYGVSYYYRVFATNEAGADWADSTESFKVNPFPIDRPTDEGLIVSQYDTVNDPANLEPLSLLQGIVPDGTSFQLNAINYPNGQIVPNFAFITDGNNFSLMFEGVFFPDGGAGTYTFGLTTDNRGVMYLDLNNDGDFDDGFVADPGELIMDFDCCQPHITTVTLEDRPYRFAVAMQEFGGGEVIEAKWRFGTFSQYAELNYIDGTSGAFFQDFGPFAVANLPAQSITHTSAVIEATLSESNAVYCMHAYWGSTDGGTNAAAWSNNAVLGCFTNADQMTFTQFVGGLVSNTDVYYTFRATNCLDDLWAPTSFSFRTAGLPRVVNQAGATDVGVGRANLAGVIVTGNVANVVVYWGASDGGMNPSAWDNAVVLGMKDIELHRL
ncbi:MAG: hypothetical protein AAF492_16030, partial [Verrucomicrobiota bacterium]